MEDDAAVPESSDDSMHFLYNKKDKIKKDIFSIKHDE
jgi:hypothetical protein